MAIETLSCGSNPVPMVRSDVRDHRGRQDRARPSLSREP